MFGAVVLPHSILFDEKEMRMKLVKMQEIEVA